MIESKKQWLTRGGILAMLLKSWTSLDQNSIKRIYKASQPISLIEQLQHPFRVRNFWDRLIPNCGCHSNQSFPYTCSYYNRDVNDIRIPSVLPWVHA